MKNNQIRLIDEPWEFGESPNDVFLVWRDDFYRSVYRADLRDEDEIRCGPAMIDTYLAIFDHWYINESHWEGGWNQLVDDPNPLAGLYGHSNDCMCCLCCDEPLGLTGAERVAKFMRCRHAQ